MKSGDILTKERLIAFLHEQIDGADNDKLISFFEACFDYGIDMRLIRMGHIDSFMVWEETNLN